MPCRRSSGSRPAPLRWKARARALAAALALLLAAAGTAEATNGLALVGQSAKGAGRGGAVTAIADDALSAAHNPALITELPPLRLDGTMIWFGERIRERTATKDKEDNNLVPFPLPIVSLAWDPLAEEVVLDGEVITRQSDLRVAFSLFQPITLVFAPSATIGFRISETLSVGASLNFLLAFLSFESEGSVGGGGSDRNDYVPGGIVRIFREADGTPVVPPQPFDAGTGQVVTWAELFELVNNDVPGQPEDEEDEAETKIEIDDVFGWGLAGQLGVHWRPHPDLAFGATFQTPGIIFNPRGTGSIDVTEVIVALNDDPVVQQLVGALIDTYTPDAGSGGFNAQYDISAEKIILPASVSVGAAWWIHDRWLLTMDFRWIGWDAAFNTIVLKAEGGENNDFNEINGGRDVRHRFRLEWDDQLVIAIGTSVAVTDWMVLRAGFNRGTSPIPKEFRSANSLVVENHVSFGLGLHFGRWDFDAAYVWGLPIEKRLEESKFKAEQHVLYLGLGYEF